MAWQGSGPLSLELALPTVGYYTLIWVLPNGRNASFGVVVMPPLPPATQRDPVFSVCSFLSLAAFGPGWTPMNGGFAQPDSPTWGDPTGPPAFSSWRPEFTQWRKQIVGVLARLGVASVREWGVGSDGGVFLENGTLAFKPVALEIRAELSAAKIGIVDLELGPEAWMGLLHQFARNLSAYAWKWQTQAQLWPKASDGIQRDYIELYNELDIHSGVGAADQYMSSVQAAAYGLAQGGDTTTKLMCGVVTDSVHDGYRQGMLDNGLLSLCDAVSFHSYDHSPLNWQGDDHTDLELVGQWRAFLTDNGAPGMPIMCTEAGSQQFTWDSTRPNPIAGAACWENGPNSSCGTVDGVRLTCINGGCSGVYRPSDLRDRIYAFEIVNKAIVYKTAGVSRSFAFLLWYYNEASGNFGLTSRDGTPVRALAALGQAIKVLGNAEYAGALPWGNWQSADVFRQPDGQLVAVIKIRRPGHQNTPPGDNSDPTEIFNSAGVGYRCNSKFPNCAVWAWYYPVTKLEGIDGRPLDTGRSACDRGGCSFTDHDDGFIYAFLAPNAVHAIQKRTSVGNLAAQRAAEPMVPVRTKVAPLAFVMRWHLDLKHVEVLAGVQHPDGNTVGSQWGYTVTPGNASSFSFSLELHALDSAVTAPETTTASLVLSIDGRQEGDLPTVAVTVPRMGAVNASWVLDLTKHADATGEVVLRVAALVESVESAKPEPSVGSAKAIALPLVIRLIVGQWDCFSRGALNTETGQCLHGGDECNLCAKP